FVLICSSVTIVLSLECARANKASAAKLWMVLTLALGSVFLGVKAVEYKAKFAHGIYPWAPHSEIYEIADLNYAAAVRIRLNDLQTDLTAKKAALEEADKAGQSSDADKNALADANERLTLVTGLVATELELEKEA